MKISICMMVKDEEKNLDRCLKSIKPLIDNDVAELIVVDTGSKDNTIKIAKNYTDKVYFHSWSNDFSSMRNITISYAKGEWIFIIDADEELENPYELIKALEQKDINDYNTIIINVKNLAQPNDKNQYTANASPRLFKNDGSFKYEGAVHNQPIFKLPCISTNVSLAHYGYIMQDKLLMEKKFKRTSSMLKDELKKNPNNIYYRYQLGTSYDMHKDYKEAFEEFRKLYSILRNSDYSIKKAYSYVYAACARAAFKNNMYSETIKICKECINLKKDYIDLYYLLSLSYEKINKKKESIKYSLKYIELYEKYNELDISKDLTVISYNIDQTSKDIICNNLAQFYFDNDEFDESYEYCSKIENNVMQIPLLVKILLHSAKYEKLIEYYDKIKDDFKIRTYFFNTIEQLLKNIDEDEKLIVYKTLSSIEGLYGTFNLIRSFADKREGLINEFLNEIDFEREPVFYSQVFTYIDDKNLILNTLKKLNTAAIRNIVNFLIADDERSYNFFHEYLVDADIDSDELMDNKLYISISYVYLLEVIKDTDYINEDYYNIYKKYVSSGINFVLNVYQRENLNSIYKCINNDEDKYFAALFLAKEAVKNDNTELAINYIREAAYSLESFAKYTNLYKDELLNINNDNISSTSNEFEECKKQVKNNIRSLIKNNNLDEAESVISEYEQIVNDDVEIVLFKSQISVARLKQ